MKKLYFVATALFLMLATTALAGNGTKVAPLDRDKDVVKVSALAYGGYNFMEKAPIIGGAVALEAFFIRAELEGGWSYVDTQLTPSRKEFGYFSPSIGVVFGKKLQFYMMGGATTWCNIATTAVTECPEDRFFADVFCWKVKSGFNITFGKRIFLNIEGGYVFNKDKTGYVPFDNAYGRVGLGYRF